MGRKHLKKPALESGRIKISDNPKQSTNLEPPKFSLKHLNGGNHCLTKCTKEEKAAFADKLRELSQTTWQKLTEAPRHGMGFEKISCFPLPPQVSKDVRMLAFRFYGMAAMIGYRIDETFYIVALDRNFKAYKH